MIILASTSSIRRQILQNAGVSFEVLALPVDEQSIKASMNQAGASVIDTAIELAYLKARRVSSKEPALLVLGADQMLEVEGKWLDKPANLAEARDQLQFLRHKTHRLISATVVVRGNVRLWHNVSTAQLTMRDFSDQFLDDYLQKSGDDVLSSVGAYKLENLGIQLFSQIEGDYFTILGLPLLPLLDFLRNHQEVKS
jgi:septum formation protein